MAIKQIRQLLIGLVVLLVLAVPVLAACTIDTDYTTADDSCEVFVGEWKIDPCIQENINQSSPMKIIVQPIACPSGYPFDACNQWCEGIWYGDPFDLMGPGWWGDACENCVEELLDDWCDKVSVNVKIYNDTHERELGWSAFNISYYEHFFDTQLNDTGEYHLKIYAKSINVSEGMETVLLNLTVSKGVWYGDCTSSQSTWRDRKKLPPAKALQSLDIPPLGGAVIYTLLCIAVGVALFIVLGKSKEERHMVIGVIFFVEWILVFIGTIAGLLGRGGMIFIGVLLIIISGYFAWVLRKVFTS